MSFKKIATAFVISGMAIGLVGCGGSGSTSNKMASNDYSDSSASIQPVSSFSGEVLSPEQELALLNQKIVYFAYDDSNINSQDQRVLSVHAKYMLEHPNIALRIKGHTDERGSRDYNIALGERRSISVERYLETKGVPANRLVTISYGKEQPMNPESNEAAWAQNRRAELEYEDIG
jgi:peptidoglycan-associated lipoprotein